MAFLEFDAQNVDFAVLECGLGGQFDSTNVAQNVSVAAITSIGLDHVDILGGTLDSIA